ncbi:MAG: hypothetical protein P4M01_14735 [Acidobacteriota bacterium]|nr:hypothetical protein [Acidobacteriota bacterium]
MPPVEWFLVLAGTVIALSGAYLRRNPERLFPSHWAPDPASLAPLRRLGAGFLFMGAFLALQMAVVLTHLPFWCGTLAGVAAGVFLVRAGGGARQHPPLSPPSRRGA